MRKIVITLCLLFCMIKHSYAVTYSGSLISGDGLVGTADWSVNVSFTWQVTYYSQYDLWVYDYVLSVPRKAISHIIIEVSDSFTSGNVFTNTPVGSTTSNWEIGTADTSTPSAPYIPSSIYGIKFEVNNQILFPFRIVTDRSPVWGDFYAKDGIAKGTWVTVYNTGFSNPDFDPYLSLPANGSVDFHILRPDTSTGGKSAIPEPATIMLFAISFVVLFAKKLKNII